MDMFSKESGDELNREQRESEDSKEGGISDDNPAPTKKKNDQQIQVKVVGQVIT